MEPRSVLERAAFIISIDTEMAWGLRHRPQLVYHYDEERVHLDRLLDLFDRYQTPATWAIVGHLMLDRCEPVDGVKHPEIVRPELAWLSGDWFDPDPATDAATDPTWYAPELVERIRAAPTPHEIGSHGFSHIMAGDPGCSRATFDSELRAAVAVAAERGITIRSLVYPRNSVGHVDVLGEHGLVAYRGRPPAPGPVNRWQRVVDRTVGSERTAVRPVREGAVWNLPATTMFDIDTRPRIWRLWIRQVQRRMAQAVSRRSLFHLWFHPHNLQNHPEESFQALEHLCRVAARYRQQGRMDTVTMGGLAAGLTQRSQAAATDVG